MDKKIQNILELDKEMKQLVASLQIDTIGGSERYFTLYHIRNNLLKGMTEDQRSEYNKVKTQE